MKETQSKGKKGKLNYFMKNNQKQISTRKRNGK
jgi:hypothetical protein